MLRRLTLDGILKGFHRLLARLEKLREQNARRDAAEAREIAAYQEKIAAAHERRNELAREANAAARIQGRIEELLA